ncbi:hypothetical protein BRD00_05645 [Halobacteriales archaeon QS_8_69_26]|nr:MAG: hypothetical protein BRD00_05645 [Halobacteriales archaeon QS_8_69_26]
MGSDSSWFSLTRFAVALLAVGVGAAAGMVYVPWVGTYLGTLVGGLAVGLAFEDRPLLEAGVAGLLAGTGAVLVSKLIGNGIIEAIVALFSLRPEMLLLSAVLSFAAGALGTHFGNDLRDGLTEPVEEPGHRPEDL